MTSSSAIAILVSKSLAFHSTHLIEIIEAEDYNEFGFKKNIGQNPIEESRNDFTSFPV